MTAPRVVQDGDLAYTIAEDVAVRDELLPWAVLRTRVVDELTRLPPIVPISLTSTLAGARARIAGGGICGLTARPTDVSAALSRANGFTARVTAPGYLPRDLTPSIEAARRILNTGAGSGTRTLDVLPPDPAPRVEFRGGRGVLLERPTPAGPEQFTTVEVRPAPPAATDVPLREALGTLRPIGTRVAAVPLTLPDQLLHRDAILRIRGRVQVRTGPGSIVPATGASVGVRGVWWDYPSTVTAPPAAPDLCAIDPTLRLACPVGATVHRCTLTVTGPDRSLRALAAPDALAVLVAPNTLLNPAGGDVIQIGNPATADDECVVTDGFDAVADPSAAIRIRLRTPLGKLHRAAEPVVAMNVGAVTPVGAVTREGLPGDGVLVASGLPAQPTSATLIVDNGTPRAAFYRATQLPSTPNGVAFSHLVALDFAGRFTWPPIARVAQIRVVASLPPHAPVQVDIALDYDDDPSVAIVLT